MQQIDRLAPQDNFLEYIPEFMIEDYTSPNVFAPMLPELRKMMSLRDAVRFISGAEWLQKIVVESRESPDRSDDENRTRWFSTEKVVDVRVFFRHSKDSADRTLGSKMRLYSLGYPYGVDKSRAKPEVQHLDSGFINTYMRGTDPSMVFQNALASTMLYRSLYCIGGPASVRKLNVPAGEGTRAPSWRSISAIRPTYSKDIDRKQFTHILHPAVVAAGLSIEDYSTDELDYLKDMFFYSRDMDEVRERLAKFPGADLTRDEVEQIIEDSNNSDANLSHSKEEFYDSPGLNVVITLKSIMSFLD